MSNLKDNLGAKIDDYIKQDSEVSAIKMVNLKEMISVTNQAKNKVIDSLIKVVNNHDILHKRMRLKEKLYGLRDDSKEEIAGLPTFEGLSKQSQDQIEEEVKEQETVILHAPEDESKESESSSESASYSHSNCSIEVLKKEAIKNVKHITGPLHKYHLFKNALSEYRNNPNTRHLNELNMKDILVLSDRDFHTLRNLVSTKTIFTGNSAKFKKLNDIYEKEKEQKKLILNELYSIQ